jgi:hypothetical protein
MSSMSAQHQSCKLSEIKVVRDEALENYVHDRAPHIYSFKITLRDGTDLDVPDEKRAQVSRILESHGFVVTSGETEQDEMGFESRWKQWTPPASPEELGHVTVDLSDSTSM